MNKFCVGDKVIPNFPPGSGYEDLFDHFVRYGYLIVKEVLGDKCIHLFDVTGTWGEEGFDLYKSQSSPRKLDDAQVGGDHYKKHKFSPWDIIDEYQLDFYAGNIIKYVLRAKDKNGVEDLKKARHYIDKLISIHEPKIINYHSK